MSKVCAICGKTRANGGHITRKGLAKKAGGIGIRYTVKIGRHTTYIYYEDPAWFVEGKEIN